jgi:hypothetical protein
MPVLHVAVQRCADRSDSRGPECPNCRDDSFLPLPSARGWERGYWPFVSVAHGQRHPVALRAFRTYASEAAATLVLESRRGRRTYPSPPLQWLAFVQRLVDLVRWGTEFFELIPTSVQIRAQSDASGAAPAARLGFRTLMDVIPVDASLVRGSLGRITDHVKDGPITQR